MSESQLTLPVDLERLHQVTKGDTLMIQELADDYFIQATELFREIDRAIQTQSIDSIKRLTHKLRGSSATFGVTALRDSVEKIDQAIAKSEFESANHSLRDAFQKLEETRIFIKTYLI